MTWVKFSRLWRALRWRGAHCYSCAKTNNRLFISKMVSVTSWPRDFKCFPVLYWNIRLHQRTAIVVVDCKQPTWRQFRVIEINEVYSVLLLQSSFSTTKTNQLWDCWKGEASGRYSFVREEFRSQQRGNFVVQSDQCEATGSQDLLG